MISKWLTSGVPRCRQHPAGSTSTRGSRMELSQGTVHSFFGYFGELLKTYFLSRAFVEFVTGNRFAMDFYNWIHDTGHVCEHYLNTLATLSVEKAVTKSNKTVWKVLQRYDRRLLKQRDHWTNNSAG